MSTLKLPTVHITSHNAAGKAVVHSSNQNEPRLHADNGVALNVAYTTSEMPVDLNDDIDMKLHQETIASGKLGLVNPNGTVCRFVDFAPGNKPLIHRTQSLDYGIVIEGSMIMELDDGSSTLMDRGDVAVQRGTMHAWKNASETEWARMIFVLQDCKPLMINGQRYKEDLGEEGQPFRSNNDN